MEGHAHDDIGCLAADARQPLQCVKIIRHLAAELRAEHLAGREDVLGLVAEEPAVADLILECREAHRHDVLRRLYFREKTLRRDIDTLVGALRREDDGNQELEWVMEDEFRLCPAVCLLEDGQLLFPYLLRYTHAIHFLFCKMAKMAKGRAQSMN